MRNKKGFTLLELLIAATIVGILAVFATVSYRNSTADAHIEAARTKTRVLASAVQRFHLDHPQLLVYALQPLADEANPDSGCVVGALPQGLILCGYVDNGGWSSDDAEFYVCMSAEGDGCAWLRNQGWTGNDFPGACMKVNAANSQLTDRYGEYGYCVSRSGAVTESFTAYPAAGN